MLNRQSYFTTAANAVSRYAGSSSAFLAACLLIVVWGACGPLFDYSDQWQLVINTGTTIITFLMVFLIQNTTSRETQAINLKIDELLHKSTEADDAMLDLEEMEINELEKLRANYLTKAEEARATRTEPPG